ncbi:cytochrome c-type biogenesis protein CcmH [Serratia sp. S1B]|nr:cytochrome c-type biogenesis protein CcmH [Serratia sp. S1B]
MKLATGLIALLLSWSAFAAIDTYQFNSLEQEQQYRQLTEQLRCPKCQNNSIADSNAITAADMRTKVYELMMQGQSKQQIIDYMVARYGNFVTYDPPVTPATLILWMGPLLLVLVGGGLVLMKARRRRDDQADPELSEFDQQRLAGLLEERDRKKT